MSFVSVCVREPVCVVFGFVVVVIFDLVGLCFAFHGFIPNLLHSSVHRSTDIPKQ